MCIRDRSSVVSANNVVVTTRDSQDKDIDTTPSLATDVIVAGALSGTLTFDTGTDTPGFLDTATLTFTVAGQVEPGGVVEVVMPDLNEGTALQSAWDFETPTVTLEGGLQSPSATFVESTRTLMFTTVGDTLLQESQLSLIHISEPTRP